MELYEILEKQRTFFREGISRNLQYRRRGLLRLWENLMRHEEELYAALYADLGKSRYEAYETEFGLVYSEINYMVRHLSSLARPQRARTALANFPAKSTIYKDPYGVVLIMSPWNYPLLLTLVPLIGALAAGNCAVVKPSAYSPETSKVIEKILHETFSEGYVYTVTGGRQANENLLAEKFDYIFFTGGKTVGRQVMEAAAKHLCPVTLELGGKSPCIVDETADIAMAARRIVWGKFLNCGQTCVAPDYVLVHSSIKEKLLAAMVANIEALYGPYPLESKDYGKIISEKHFLRLGAMLEGEAPYYFGGADDKYCKIGPVILDDADWSSLSMQEEIFGPILPVLTFTDLAEVKREIEARPKPLALYFFTKSKERERYLMTHLSFGGGCVNDTIMHLVSTSMPFGGVGASGMGCYHGKYSFRTFTHEKSVLKKSTLIDMPMRYAPYPDSLRFLKKFLK